MRRCFTLDSPPVTCRDDGPRAMTASGMLILEAEISSLPSYSLMIFGAYGLPCPTIDPSSVNLAAAIEESMQGIAVVRSLLMGDI